MYFLEETLLKHPYVSLSIINTMDVYFIYGCIFLGYMITEYNILYNICERPYLFTDEILGGTARNETQRCDFNKKKETVLGVPLSTLPPSAPSVRSLREHKQPVNWPTVSSSVVAVLWPTSRRERSRTT